MTAMATEPRGGHDYLCGRAWARHWLREVAEPLTPAAVARMALLHEPTSVAWLRGIFAAIADGE